MAERKLGNDNVHLSNFSGISHARHTVCKWSTIVGGAVCFSSVWLFHHGVWLSTMSPKLLTQKIPDNSITLLSDFFIWRYISTDVISGDNTPDCTVITFTCLWKALHAIFPNQAVIVCIVTKRGMDGGRMLRCQGSSRPVTLNWPSNQINPRCQSDSW